MNQTSGESSSESLISQLSTYGDFEEAIDLKKQEQNERYMFLPDALVALAFHLSQGSMVLGEQLESKGYINYIGRPYDHYEVRYPQNPEDINLYNQWQEREHDLKDFHTLIDQYGEYFYRFSEGNNDQIYCNLVARENFRSRRLEYARLRGVDTIFDLWDSTLIELNSNACEGKLPNIIIFRSNRSN